jgi:hypothetical protein
VKLVLRPAPWVSRDPSPELVLETKEILDSVWLEAALEYYAVRSARLRSGSQAPKGVQSFLNDAVDSRFMEHGWAGGKGRYRKGASWLRVTFRHQMSLGSDIVDAIKMARKEGADTVAIAAASAPFLRVISPNDAGALVSHEKLTAQVAELAGAIDIPLFVGRLEPISRLPQEVELALQTARPRDRYSPDPR